MGAACDSSAVYYKYCDSLAHARAVLDDRDPGVRAQDVRAQDELRADLRAMRGALKKLPLDMDVLRGFPDATKGEFPIVVLGTGEGVLDLRYVGFPADVDGVLENRDALERFVRHEVDYCLEENARMTKAALLSLRPVRAALAKGITTHIEQSGYNCCGSDVATIADGKLHM
jgi:hypothetical protein